MKGILYGVGIGPGNPELLTIQALKIIKSCPVIFIPSKEKENSTAYKIVKAGFAEIDSKEIIPLELPMIKDPKQLSISQKIAVEKICSILEKGKDAAFLTIGDSVIYSTYMYLDFLVKEKGFETILVNGIPSFSAVASRLGISLSEKDEQLHIIPGSYSLENVFDLSGTLVFMKSGKKILELKNFLLEKSKDYEFDFHAVSDCGMETEKICGKIEELSENESYFTTVIVKNIKCRKQEKNYSFFQNKNCENFPCHKTECVENFNCLFCYCPLYFLGDKCGGNFKYNEKGIKSCINCDFPHKKENYDKVNLILKNAFK